jgi:hypothetical protein
VVFLSLWLPVMYTYALFAPCLLILSIWMLEWTDSAVFQQCTDMEKCYTYLVIKVKLLLDVECEIEVSTTP